MFSTRQELWSDSSLHFEGWLYDPIILALLRDCTSESTYPRPHFQALQYRFCSVLSIATLLFLLFLLQKPISTIYITLLSSSLRRSSAPIQLAIVLVVLGTQEISCIWLQGRLRETIFILHLSRIDKPQVIHLREICYCPTKLRAWRPNTRLQE